jgi:hypothetical protein
MQKYIATPWCHCDNKFKNCKYCRYKSPCYKIENTRTCIKQEPQSHGGNLFQHSQWSSLYLTMWYTNVYESENPVPENYLHVLLGEIANSVLIKSVISDDKETIKRFIQLCGFMHDIGKGGDGFTDMYLKDKYIKYNNTFTGDQYHPEVCKIAIIVPEKYNFYKGNLKKVLDTILNSYNNPEQARFILALVASVHWNFGKLFDAKSTYNPEIYLRDYISQIKDINQRIFNNNSDVKFPLLLQSDIIIKLCMVVSCSDIASSNNKELFDEKNEQINICDNKNAEIFEKIKIDDIPVSKCNYTSYGNKWMNIKKVANNNIPIFQEKMNQVINLFAQLPSSSKNEIKNGGLNAQRCNKNTIIKNAGRKINKSKKTRKSRITRKYRKTPHS